MAGAFTGAVTTYTDIYPVLIEKLELKATGETVSQYVEMGAFDKGAEMDIKPKGGGIPMSGGRKKEGYLEVSIKGNLIVTGVANRTALAVLATVQADSRWTDRSGRKWSFTGAQVSVTVGESNKGDGEGSTMLPIEATGLISLAEWAAAYSAT